MSYTTLHLVYDKTFIDISDVCAIPGTTCVRLDSLGSLGALISHVCVDFNWVPSGGLMVRFFLLILMLENFVPGRMKCPVAPESATAISTAILMFGVLSIVSVFGASRTLRVDGGSGTIFLVGLSFLFLSCPWLLLITVTSSSSFCASNAK